MYFYFFTYLIIYFFILAEFRNITGNALNKQVPIDKFNEYMLLFIFLPFPKRQILDASKLKELAVDNFKFDEKDERFSKWVENSVGKGEIACYEQFLLFPESFQKT